jgi:predicted ATPase
LAKKILGDSYKLVCRVNGINLSSKKKNGYLNKNKNAESIIINFYLEDSKKNELGFDDVGTGISQVLPVIPSIINYEHTIFLQPELHLHPKAQANLGDLFIFALQKQIERNTKHSGVSIGKILIETHSEHLILRLLRRIKENNGNPSDIIFTNKNLSLIYVSPQKIGSEINWIRIDKHGDFIDVWPNGFFEDRYDDLFFLKK